MILIIIHKFIYKNVSIKMIDSASATLSPNFKMFNFCKKGHV